MKKEYIEKQKNETKIIIERLKQLGKDTLKEFSFNDENKDFANALKNFEKQMEIEKESDVKQYLVKQFFELHQVFSSMEVEKYKEDYENNQSKMAKLFYILDNIWKMGVKLTFLDDIVDKGPLKVENKTIVITDPAYLVDEDDEELKKCDFCLNLGALGMHNNLVSRTLSGDWSCTTYNVDTKEKLGNFCADTGLVSVCLLDEILTYDKSLLEWLNLHNWCATVIENFTGEIWIKIEKDESEDENEDNYTAYVEGIGNINFKTTQTGI